MINVTELRPGNYFTVEGGIYTVLDVSLNKTAMRKMVVKVKVKNVRTGAVTEMSFLGGTNIEPIFLDKRAMQYLYDSGDFLVFMDNENYDQVEVPLERLQYEKNFLKGNEIVEIVFYESEILGISLPAKVTLKVVECEPAVKGDTVTRAMKDAVLETGLKIKVPLFVNEGEDVIVRTTDSTYDGRA